MLGSEEISQDAEENTILFQKLQNFEPTTVPVLDLSRENDDHAEKLGSTYTIEKWKDPNFDATKELKKMPGILLEVGGPTFGGYQILDTKKLEEDLHKKIFVTNLYPGQPVYGDTEDRKPINVQGTVDFRADATNLALDDAKVSALFASSLPDDIREQTLVEAKRVLEPGGLLIWQHAHPKNLEDAQKLGYKLKQYLKTDYYNRSVILDLILQKPENEILE